MMTTLINGSVFDGKRFHDQAQVVVDGEHVFSLDTALTQPVESGEIVDLNGRLLAPGFVDVQVNGGGGRLFNRPPTVETIQHIAAAHRRFGTTTLLPTLISDDWSVMQQAADSISLALEQKIPGVRGIHFEGPYLTKEKRGIHDVEKVRTPEAEALTLLTRKDLGACVVSLAPDRVELSFIRALNQAGVRVCLGHSNASYERAMEGVNAGATGFTHVFNAMSPLTSRAPNMVGAALDSKDTWCGIIADGHHVDKATLRIAVSAKPKGKMMLVTDAMPSVGSKDESFDIGGREIFKRDGCCKAADGTIAGSDLSMMKAVQNAVEWLEVSREEALRMASLYPAQFLKLDNQIGRIETGYDADFVELDPGTLDVCATWVRGVRRFSKENAA